MPEMPASPRIKLVFALAIFGGLVAGLGISFVLDGANTSIRTADESEQYLALPVLGEIPRLSKNEINNSIVMADSDRDSAAAEIFRTLRTTLSMLGRETDRKTYLFTSALPDEGKTFASVNYAASLAQQGLRTLLIDMDLRRPMIEELFTGKRSLLPGVTDYFSGHKTFDELCVQHLDIPKLFWIPGGSPVPNPLELLTQSDFHQLLDRALGDYDRVVIDTAPLLPVSDALILAGEVQTVVLVVQSGKTPRKAVQRSVQLLKQADVTIGGILLNLMPLRLSKGHYYSSIYV
jgi:capsular exopolysaccharide synthesis family protein